MLPADCYPLKIEAFRISDDSLAWERNVTLEEARGLMSLHIPGRDEVGDWVWIRLTYGDGEVMEAGKDRREA